MSYRPAATTRRLQCVAACCSVLQRVAACVAVCCSMLQNVAVRCSALQCVAVCCSVLQCVAVCALYTNESCPEVNSSHLWSWDTPDSARIIHVERHVPYSKVINQWVMSRGDWVSLMNMGHAGVGENHSYRTWCPIFISQTHSYSIIHVERHVPYSQSRRIHTYEWTHSILCT